MRIARFEYRGPEKLVGSGFGGENYDLASGKVLEDWWEMASARANTRESSNDLRTLLFADGPVTAQGCCHSDVIRAPPPCSVCCRNKAFS